MKISKWIFLLLVNALLLLGCSENNSDVDYSDLVSFRGDYNEKIGDTGLSIIRTSSTSIVISSDENPKLFVGNIVISYEQHHNYVYGIRQVANFYSCDNSEVALEITDRLQFFVIDAADKSETNATLFFENYYDWSSYLDEKDLPHGHIEGAPKEALKIIQHPTHPVGKHCLNPKL